MFRTTSQYLQFRLRSCSVSRNVYKCVKEVDEDGIAVIENFLNHEQFTSVRAEFEDAFKNVELQPYKNGTNTRLYRMQIPLSDATHGGTKLHQNFQRNDRLNAIASAVVRRRISRPPNVHLDWYQSNNSAALDNDIENILHADLHTATVKLFFLLRMLTI